MSEPNDLTDKLQKQMSTTSRWRRAAIIVSLLMVLLASFFIFLLSNAVDREMARMATSSQLREQSDLVLINLIEMGTLDRSYSVNRNREDYERFQKASKNLDDVLDYIGLITHGHQNWEDWYRALKEEVEQRRSNMLRRIHTVNSLPKEDAARMIAGEVYAPSVDKLTKLITTFLAGDGDNRQKRREDIAMMRAALTLAAIVSVISTFVLAYSVINRFRRDIRKLKTYQLLLHSENAALEERVKERTKELVSARNHAERERRRVELLLQDASHRIGNSLATVSSLLSLQLNRSKNEEVRAALSAARDRIQTISAAHRRLRLSDDMETTALADFLRSVVHDVELGLPFELREKVQIETEFKDCRLPSRDATTLGIILGELLTNSIKHAFPDQRSGKIHLSFGEDSDGQNALIVEDNGVGMNEKDDGRQAGLGKLVIQQLCMQFGEKPIFEKTSTGGTKVIIPLPKLTILQ